MVISPKVELIAYLSLHVLYLLPHHDFTPSLVHQIRLPLDDRPVNLLLRLQIISLEEVFILLHESVVHLRRVPFVHSVVELLRGCLW
jgi:hypothetical protein